MNRRAQTAEMGERYRSRRWIRCWICDGTGTAGEGDECWHCEKCDGHGQVEMSVAEACPCFA